jgi:hypothetical protein
LGGITIVEIIEELCRLAVEVCKKRLGVSHRRNSCTHNEQADKDKQDCRPGEFRVRVVGVLAAAALGRALLGADAAA